MTTTEPSTGYTIDTSGLSPEEKLMVEILCVVDPREYDGTLASSCLIGQVARKSPIAQETYYEQRIEGGPALVAAAFGVFRLEVLTIWSMVTLPEYAHDARRAIRESARCLGISDQRYKQLYKLVKSSGRYS